MTTLSQEIKTIFGNNNAVQVLLMTKTKVKTAAAFKHLSIIKVSATIVTLDKQSSYTDHVINSALKLNENSEKVESVLDFQAKASIYDHDADYYCLMSKGDTQYLYATLVSSNATYLLNDVELDKQTVASYMTPSEAKKLLEPTKHTANVGNDIEHDVKVLTYKLSSIESVQVIESGKVIRNTEFSI